MSPAPSAGKGRGCNIFLCVLKDLQIEGVLSVGVVSNSLHVEISHAYGIPYSRNFHTVQILVYFICSLEIQN